MGNAVGTLGGGAWEKCCVDSELFSTAVRICLYRLPPSRHYLPVQVCLQKMILGRYLHTEPPYRDCLLVVRRH